MFINAFNLIVKFVSFLIFGRFDKFLKNSSGLIHIGANSGQERNHYKKLGVKRVIWIEADPQVYKILSKNIKNYKNNIAYNYLVSEENKSNVQFNIANNNSNSSSVLKLKQAKRLYPGLNYIKKVFLNSKNLQTIIRKKKINLSNFNCLVLDVKGEELYVLKWNGNKIYKFRYIKLEASEFEMYKQNCFYNEISEYLSLFGFKEIKKVVIAQNYRGEKAYDVLYYNSQFSSED